MKLNPLLISIALVSSLAVGSSVALAQDDTTPPADPASQLMGPPPNHQQGVPPQGQPQGHQPQGHQPQGQPQGHQPQGRMPRRPWYPATTTDTSTTQLVDWFQEDEFLELVEQYTGLTLSELRTASQAGETAAELIEANGQSVDAFLAAVMNQVNAELDDAVAEGLLTSSQASNLETQVQATVSQWVSGDLLEMILAGL